MSYHENNPATTTSNREYYKNNRREELINGLRDRGEAYLCRACANTNNPSFRKLRWI